MKKAYIHIGHEKTGTSAVQIFLQKNAAVLQEHNFVYLGDDSRPYVHGIGHFPIVGSFYESCPNFIPLRKHKPSDYVLSALYKDVQNTDHDIILSCEHFASRLDKRENIEALKNALSGRDIKIICYLRRQDDQALSLYSTLVKGGATFPFSISDISPKNRYFNYYTILRDWAAVFGDENILIREYARASLVNQDICADFLNVLGVEMVKFESVGDKNVSLDALQIGILRQLNRHLTSYPWGGTNIDLTEFERSQNIRVALTPHLSAGSPIQTLMKKSDRVEILSILKESNFKAADAFDAANFILDWHHSENIYEQGDDKLNTYQITLDDFGQSLVSCGQMLHEQQNIINHQKELLVQRDQEKCKALKERDHALRLLKDAQKPLVSRLLKSIKKQLTSAD